MFDDQVVPAVDGNTTGDDERFPVIAILDDLAYVAKDQAETSVLFELISARYERRSLLINANQPFGEWGKIFTEHSFS